MLRYIILLLLAFNVNAKPFSSAEINNDANGNECVTIVYKDHRVVNYNLTGVCVIKHEEWFLYQEAVKMKPTDFNLLKQGIKKIKL
jgi:hypothetical protein